MDALPFETPEFAATLDDCEIWLAAWVAQYRAAFTACYGQPIEVMYAGLANGLIVAGARLVAGFLSSDKSSRRARHAAYSTGAIQAPRRETRAQRIARECRALGLQGAA